MRKIPKTGKQVQDRLAIGASRPNGRFSLEKYLASGEQIRKTIKTAPANCTWTLNIATRQVTVTSAALRVHNLCSRHDTPLPFEKLLQSIYPMDRQQVEEAVASALSGTTLLLVAYRCLGPGGAISWLEAHGGVYHTSTGDLLKVWVQDITEQRVRELHNEFMENITDRIHYIENPVDVLETAAEAVGSHLCLSHCFFAKTQSTRKQALVFGGYHPGGAPSGTGMIEVALPDRIRRADLQNGRMLACADVEKDSRLLSRDCREWYLRHRFRAFVVVPVSQQRKSVVLFWAVSEVPRTWGTQELALLEKAAKRSWNVSEKVRMREHSQKIQSALDHQSRLLEALSAAVPDCLCVFDTQGKVVYANRILLDLWGLGREEALGKTMRELGYPDEAAETLLRGMERVIASGEVVINEIAYTSLTGASVQYENVLSPMFGEDGRVAFIAGASRNVTEHRQAEEALRRSRQRFELLSKVAEELLRSEQPQEVIQHVCCEVMHYLDCQIFFNFLADEKRQVLCLHAWSGITDETAKELEQRPFGVAISGCSARDGVRIVAERIPELQDPRCDVVRSLGITAYACHPLIGGGRVIGTLSFGTCTRMSFTDDELSLMKTVADQVAVAMEQARLLEELRRARKRLESRVTERTMELRDLVRKLIERERLLQEQKALIKAVLECLPIGVMVIDREGTIVETNPAAEEIWAGICNRDRSWYKNFRAWWANTGKPITDNEWAGVRALSCGETFLNQEIEIEAFDGTRKTVLNSAVPIRGKNEEILAAVVTMGDITRRKQTEVSLKRSEEQLRVLSSRLLAAQENERQNIAREVHDSLGASLSVVKMKVESALQEVMKVSMPATTEALLAASAVVKDSIEECRRIQMDLRPAMLDDLGVVSAFSWYLRRFKTIFPHIQVETSIKVEDRDVPDALKTTVFRVAQEAMNNIVKHSHAGRVRLSLQRLDGRIELMIADNGTGFDLPRVFSGKAEKCGIGLSSMRERAQLSGGTFYIKSRKGKGTTIKASWPLEKG